MARIRDFWHERIITRSGAESVIYDLRNRHRTIITLPAASKWTSGLHWHETHDEYLQVIKGSVRVVLGERKFVVSAPQNSEDTPVIKVDKFVRHEWGRADNGLDHEAGDVVVMEHTEPADGNKTEFFWCVNGVILNGIVAISAARGLERMIEEWKMYLRLLCVFSAHDNYPVVLRTCNAINYWCPALQDLVDYSATKALLGMGIVFARLVGRSLNVEDYLPPSKGDDTIVLSRHRSGCVDTSSRRLDDTEQSYNSCHYDPKAALQ